MPPDGAKISGGMMFRRIKEKLYRSRRLCWAALTVIRAGLIVSCLLLSVSLLVAVAAGELTSTTYELHYLYSELYRAPLGVLIISSLGALVFEDRFGNP